MTIDHDALLDPKLLARFGTYRNIPWVQRRVAQLADVLRVPIDDVWDWEDDWRREAVSRAEWERLKDRYVVYRDNVLCRAIGCCVRKTLSVADVQRAEDRALLALDGMGPKGVVALRGFLSRAAPPPPFPEWLAEE